MNKNLQYIIKIVGPARVHGLQILEKGEDRIVYQDNVEMELIWWTENIDLHPDGRMEITITPADRR